MGGGGCWGAVFISAAVAAHSWAVSAISGAAALSAAAAPLSGPNSGDDAHVLSPAVPSAAAAAAAAPIHEYLNNVQCSCLGCDKRGPYLYSSMVALSVPAQECLLAGSAVPAAAPPNPDVTRPPHGRVKSMHTHLHAGQTDAYDEWSDPSTRTSATDRDYAAPFVDAILGHALLSPRKYNLFSIYFS